MNFVKHDEGKPDWTLLPLLPLREVVDVLMYGAKKYSPHNWIKGTRQRYRAAAWRHWIAYEAGEPRDPETGRSHLAHLICCALYLLYFELTGTGFGDEGETSAKETSSPEIRPGIDFPS